jgi:ubiquinone/menaquinone biosynthesis C-methylase UbiE
MVNAIIRPPGGFTISIMTTRYPRRLLVLAAFALGLGHAVAAQQQDPEAYAKTLEGAARVARMQVPRVIETLVIPPGSKVADIGAGSGLFSRPIAQHLGRAGTLYAVDIDPGLLKIIDRRATEEKIPNIRTILAAPDDPKLPEQVDLAFICDALHHIGNQAAYFKTLVKYVKPNGRIAVIDFSEKWPVGHESMRYSVADLDGWMKAVGFTQVASHSYLENSFFVIYRRS